MRKLFLPLLCMIFVALSCYEEEIESFKEQMDEIENETIRSVQEQMTALTTSVLDLSKIDMQLKDYINVLQEDTEALEEAVRLADERLESAKKELREDMSASSAEQLAQLETFKSLMQTSLSDITETIAELQARDSALEDMIAGLRDYVDERMKDNAEIKEWASVTFATMEMYDSLTSEVAHLRAELESLDSVLEKLIRDEVTDMFPDIIDAINPVLLKFKEDMEAECANSLQVSLSSLESGMKSWVNESLSSYSTISAVDAKISALRSELENNLTVQQQYLHNLMENMEQRLTRKIEYNAALIEALRGDMDGLDGSLAEVVLNVADNSEAISANADRIAANSGKISENTDDVEGNSALIAANRTLLEKNMELVNENKELIEANGSAIASNSVRISENMLAISRNASEISSNATLISTNAAAISNNSAAISSNAEAIEDLRIQLDVAKEEITTAYKSAIVASINTLDGKLTGKIVDEVSALNTHINEEVAAVDAVIRLLEGRVVSCENDIKSLKTSVYALQLEIKDIKAQITEILSMIQSVTYVPKFDDGYATMYYSMSDGVFVPGVSVLKYDIRPQTAAAALAEVWQEALNVRAVYTMTRAAGDFCNLNIIGADVEDSFLTVTVSGDALSEDFYLSKVAASVSVVISDGASEYASEYARLMPYAPEEDEVFKSWLLDNHDENRDGELSDEEARAITSISFTDDYKGVTSLDGIERLVNLVHLDARGQNISVLDLSDNKKLKYLNVRGNALRRLNLDGCAALETLDCSDNELSSLDIKDSESLVSLYCNGNDFQSLSLKNLSVLKNLECRDNEIVSLDLTRNKELLTLDCSANRLSLLNLSENSALTALNCRTNNLTNLLLSGCSALRSLDCRENLLSNLNISSCTVLETLDCSDNQIEALDLINNSALTVLNCSDNSLKSLVASNMDGLLVLDCSGNASMTKLWLKDVVQEGSMTIAKDKGVSVHYNSGGIYIPDAKLKEYLVNSYDDDFDGEISIVESENIVAVNCANKGISDLTGLEVCTNIERINCSGNNISIVDCHTLTRLQSLSCYDNPIEKLDLSNCSELTGLYIIGASVNAISGDKLTINGYDRALCLDINLTGMPINMLTVTGSNVLQSLDVAKNEDIEKFNFNGNTALAKVSLSPVFEYVSGYDCFSLESIDLSSLTNLQELYIQGCKLSELDLTKNSVLKKINCSRNMLTSLNLDDNVELVSVDCSDNDLSRIKLTNNTALESLNISGNRLISINLKANIALRDLRISDNTNISSPYLNYNTALETLYADGLSITDIDLSANTLLKRLSLIDCDNLTTFYSWEGFSDIVTGIGVSHLVNRVDPQSASHKFPSVGTRLFDRTDGQGVVFDVGNDYCKIVSVKYHALQWGEYYTSVGAYSKGNGKANTELIKAISGWETTYPAFYWCASYGDGEWYLPALNELKTIYNNKSVINVGLSSNGEALGTNLYWSSTEYDSGNAYGLYLQYGSTSEEDKSDSERVRAVRAL